MLKAMRQKTLLGPGKEQEQRPRARVLSAQREPEHNAKAEMPRQTKARRRQLHWRDAKSHEAENPGVQKTRQNRGRVRACYLHTFMMTRTCE